MRILLVQRHFWPEVGAPAGMARAIAQRLGADGHDVTVLSSMPAFVYGGADQLARSVSRRDNADGFKVIRARLPRTRKAQLSGRLFDMIGFSAVVAGHLLTHGRRYDAYCVSSEPPVVLPSVVRMAARLMRRPYVYHCQDLNPEAALLAGLLRSGIRARVLAHLDRANVRHASATIVLSSDMASALRERCPGCGDRVIIINNFITTKEDTFTELSAAFRKPAGTFRVLFAGNLGLLQDLDSVVEAARLVGPNSGIQFAFVGAGVRAPALKALAGDMLGKQVAFLPDQTPAAALELMRDADLGLVTLAPGVFRVAYPSKTLAYLEAGCPVVAAVEEGSELAQLVRSTGIGAICPPAYPEALARVILRRREAGPPGELERARVRAIGALHFGPGRALDTWAEVFRRLGKGGAGG